MNEHKIAFSYFGGKSYHMNFLLPLMPHPGDMMGFVDVFGGSGQVIMNVPRYSMMVYNDIDGELVNLFRCLRDRRDELIERLQLTLYARGELAIALEGTECDPVERARRFFVRLRQGFTSIPARTVRSWSRDLGGCKGKVVDKWLRSVDKLEEVAGIFKGIQIDNDPAVKIIAAYARPDTFLYCDPPYLHHTRRAQKVEYRHEMTLEDHEELAVALNSCESPVMVSGYDHEIYNDLFPESRGWKRYDDVEKSSAATRLTFDAHPRRESVWINYDPPQGRLF